MDFLAWMGFIAGAAGCAAAFFLYLRAARFEEQASQLLAEREDGLKARMDLEKQLALAEQALKAERAGREEWRQQILDMAHSTALKTGNDISSKLLDDHKREAEAVKKQNEEATRAATTGLLEQVKLMTENMAILRQQQEEGKGRLDTLWKSLSTPGGAGALAEIGLENSLKRLNLEAGRDFLTQYTVAGESGKLRPDAVVFLPQDEVMVIDSKASRFLLEIASAEDEAAMLAAREQLKRTMNEHLRGLKSKDYENAVRSAYKASGRGKDVGTVHMVMYLPSEAAIEHLREADQEFSLRCSREGIMLAGPATLQALLSLARLRIYEARKRDKQEDIIETTHRLMDSLITSYGYIDKMARGMKSSADEFEKFIKSTNAQVLPKMRRLTSLGVSPSKQEKLPVSLSSIEIRISENTLLIEAESEAETSAPELALVK